MLSRQPRALVGKLPEGAPLQLRVGTRVMSLDDGKVITTLRAGRTHTHTHICIYIYIYIYMWTNKPVGQMEGRSSV